MKTRLHALLCAGLLLCCSGCSLVYCEEPFGKPLDPSELKQFEGQWMLDQVLSVHLGKEHLVGGILKFDSERDEFVASNAALHLRRTEKVMMLFVQETPEKPCTMLYVTKATPLKLVCRLGDTKKFGSLLDEGRIKGGRLGEAKGKNEPSIIVEFSQESFSALLKDVSIDELFPPEKALTIEKYVPPSK